MLKFETFAPKSAKLRRLRGNRRKGLLNGAIQIGTMIESGQIQAGIVVGTENSRHLVERTVKDLNENTELTRRAIKSAIASLTIGSGSCAILLTHRSISKSGNRFFGGSVRANTKH